MSGDPLVNMSAIIELGDSGKHNAEEAIITAPVQTIPIIDIFIFNLFLP
jgi:hypothetical protein